MKPKNYHIKNIKLANEGRDKIQWAYQRMPVLALIRNEFKKKKPLKGINVGCCLHVTTETANLVITLKEAGANVALCASNPLSTQNSVASSLVRHSKIEVFAINGEDRKTYYRHIQDVLDTKPNITMDDGADLISTLHGERKDILDYVWAGTEETTTGVNRLKSLEKKNKLKYPVIAVNNAQTKYLFDNRYGTGQSTIDGIVRATDKLIAGCNFVVCGYGWCGRGVAMRAHGLGAKVIITEVNPIRALEATLDGFCVLPIKDASQIGDIFVTTTGDINVIRKSHFKLMKDKAIIANAGHFNVELNLSELEELSYRKKKVARYIEEYTLRSGKRIYLLGEGRLINLVAASGHPAEVMDMSFANQALACEFIVRNKDKLEKKVYSVPEEIDRRVAELKLKSMNISIDSLTKQQKTYLTSWKLGT